MDEIKNKNKRVGIRIAAYVSTLFIIFCLLFIPFDLNDRHHKILGHGHYAAHAINYSGDDIWEFSFNTYVNPYRFTIFHNGKLFDFGTWEFISSEKDCVNMYGDRDRINFGFLSYEDNWNFVILDDSGKYQQFIAGNPDGPYRDIAETDLEFYQQRINQNN